MVTALETSNQPKFGTCAEIRRLYLEIAYMSHLLLDIRNKSQLIYKNLIIIYQPGWNNPW